MVTTYCLGFAFSNNCTSTLLIRKLRPAWQAGRFNGIGGHVEDGETPTQAMVREFQEETNISSTVDDWTYVGMLKGISFQVLVFTTDRLNIGQAKSMTDEPVSQRAVARLPAIQHMITNVPALIHLCHAKLLDQNMAAFTIEYNS